MARKLKKLPHPCRMQQLYSLVLLNQAVLPPADILKVNAQPYRKAIRIAVPDLTD